MLHRPQFASHLPTRRGNTTQARPQRSVVPGDFSAMLDCFPDDGLQLIRADINGEGHDGASHIQAVVTATGCPTFFYFSPEDRISHVGGIIARCSPCSSKGAFPKTRSLGAHGTWPAPTDWSTLVCVHGASVGPGQTTRVRQSNLSVADCALVAGSPGKRKHLFPFFGALLLGASNANRQDRATPHAQHRLIRFSLTYQLNFPTLTHRNSNVVFSPTELASHTNNLPGGDVCLS